MSDTKPRPTHRCAWCGRRIKGKIRLSSKGKGGKRFCDAGCGPKTGGRTR